VERCWW